jgi:ABC-type transport system substrate-binding protein
MLAILFSTNIPKASARQGAQVDSVRLLVIKSPDAQLVGLKTGLVDFLPDVIRPSDIEDLSSSGYLVTSTPGFHMGFVGFNLKRPYLSDMTIRHALVLGYDQAEIIASIYRYTVTPVHSLVPPAQGEWMSTTMHSYPFNPGKSTDAAGTESVFGVMYNGGYVYHGTGYGDLSAYWTDSLGTKLPTWNFWTPTYEVAPTSAEHGNRICAEWHKCGFNNIIFSPQDFNTYTHSVFYDHNFDIFMIFWRLGRFPTQLYDMCYSGEYLHPGSSQAVGLNDSKLDGYLTTFKYSLDHTTAVNAAHAAQDWLYDPTNTQGLPYMLMYSRVYFNAAAKSLDGIVNSPGYGSDNIWTWWNWHWDISHAASVIYCNGEDPGTLNPLAISTTYEANVVGPTEDAGIAVNPYTHGDVAWQEAQLPTVVGPITTTTAHGVKIVNGMSATYYIRNDIYWQDGNPFDADSAIFSLNFLWKNQIPAYIAVWKDIADIVKNDQFTFTVYANITSPFVVYDWDGGAYICPPKVWSWLDGKPLATILAYDPTANTTSTGPWFGTANGGPPTQLFGTGAFLFEKWDKVGEYCDLSNWAASGSNKGYYKTSDAIATLKTNLFHAIGDVDSDGQVWTSDKYYFGLAFGSVTGGAHWDARADLTGDGRVDFEDGALIGAFWGKHKEYVKA